jgi:hypothetical protein
VYADLAVKWYHISMKKIIILVTIIAVLVLVFFLYKNDPKSKITSCAGLDSSIRITDSPKGNWKLGGVKSISWFSCNIPSDAILVLTYKEVGVNNPREYIFPTPDIKLNSGNYKVELPTIWSDLYIDYNQKPRTGSYQIIATIFSKGKECGGGFPMPILEGEFKGKFCGQLNEEEKKKEGYSIKLAESISDNIFTVE